MYVLKNDCLQTECLKHVCLIILLLLIFVFFFVSGVITRMFTAMSAHICPAFEKMLTATRVHICPASKNDDNNECAHISILCWKFISAHV